MTDEMITACEQCGVGVLNPGMHDRWHLGEAEPTLPASSLATTSSPPSWWRQRVAAQDLKRTQKRGQRNLR